MIIPKTIIEIGDYAFCGSEGIRSIIIPLSVKTIGEGAFANSALQSLFITNPNLIINREMFGKALPHLFVPQGCLDKFTTMLRSKDDDYVEVFGWSGEIDEWDGINMDIDVKENESENNFIDKIDEFFNRVKL